MVHIFILFYIKDMEKDEERMRVTVRRASLFAGCSVPKVPLECHINHFDKKLETAGEWMR